MTTDGHQRVKRTPYLRFMRYQFGRRWPIVVLVLIAITAAPGLWYWNEISLAPDKFVEEWVKLIVTTIAVAIVVDVIIARREEAEAAASAVAAVKRDYVERIDRIVQHLRMLQSVAPNDLNEQDRVIALAHRDWREFQDRYHAEFVLDTPHHLEDLHIQMIRDCNYDKCDNLIATALTMLPLARADRCDLAIDALADVRKAFTYEKVSTS